jgi:hypothetical protein
MNFWKAAGAIIWKDIRAELRTKDILSSVFVFALLAVIIFNFAFDLRVPSMKMVVPASSGSPSASQARWGLIARSSSSRTRAAWRGCYLHR